MAVLGCFSALATFSTDIAVEAITKLLYQLVSLINFTSKPMERELVVISNITLPLNPLCVPGEGAYSL